MVRAHLEGATRRAAVLVVTAIAVAMPAMAGNEKAAAQPHVAAQKSAQAQP